MNEEKNRKENLPLIIGFALIILVIIFTLFRDNIFSQKENSSKESPKESSKESPSYITINSNDLNKQLLNFKTKDTLVLLDIRKFESYINEHIIDSINVPIDQFPVASKIDTRKTIIIIAENGADTNIPEAVKKIKEEKIEKIKVLAGGLESWKETIGSTVTYGDPKSFVDQAKVSYLNPEELNDAIKKDIPLFIVDVRTSQEYSTGHIKGAINIPFEEIEKKRKEVTESKIVLVGINELQEFQAAVQLHDMLLVSPFVMRGAMPKWQELKFEIIKQ